MELSFRPARGEDLPALVDMLASDALGSTRENPARPLDHRYRDAFRHVEQDPNNALTVVESDGRIVGMLQLTFIPYITHCGTWRCQIEGVRIADHCRGQGLGTRFIQWAIQQAKERGCGLVQLTSDKQRPDAIRFYASLGFSPTHEGFKLRLE